MNNENDLFATPPTETPAPPAPKRRGRPPKKKVADVAAENNVNTAAQAPAAPESAPAPAPAPAKEIPAAQPAAPAPAPVPAPTPAPAVEVAPAPAPAAEPAASIPDPTAICPHESESTPAQPAPPPAHRQDDNNHRNNHNNGNNNNNRHNNKNNRRNNKNRNNHNRNNHNNNSNQDDFIDEENIVIDPNAPRLNITELQEKSIRELAAMGVELGIEGIGALEKSTLICEILRTGAEKNCVLCGSGYLEVLPDGFGFLRSPIYSYLPSPEDIYLSPSQIKRFALKTGDFLTGIIRPPREKERFFAMLK